MKLKEQKVSNKELKWSAKHINFISKIKQHIQEKHQQRFDCICKNEVNNSQQVGFFKLQTVYFFCEIAKKSA